MPALGAVGHLVGPQVQLALNPYVALWSRLDGFQPGELARLSFHTSVGSRGARSTS